MNKRLRHFLFSLCLTSGTCPAMWAQAPTDSLSLANWNFHFQQTVVTQYKFPFTPHAIGPNTLKPSEPAQTSLTATVFVGRRLWRGAQLYFNPEIAGGTGLSGATGIAGFSNGETFRIGNPKPQIYLARLYARQVIELSVGDKKEWVEDEVNQLASLLPAHYLAFTVGRFGNADFFDNNHWSHDPRTQFLNWSLMSMGAWDYPANTRGYTWGVVAEWVTPKGTIRASSALEPLVANGPALDWRIRQSHSETLEWERKTQVAGRNGTIRLLAFRSKAGMGSYHQSLLYTDAEPDIITTRRPGRTKYGLGINLEQSLGQASGFFLRASWNDGRNETWAFTEIDHSVSGGFSCSGKAWHRSSDQLGIALVENGISRNHQAYLAAGGRGFMLGDGTLHYAPEGIIEAYYAFQLRQWHLAITPDYQCILNPGYNQQNRGPIQIIAARVHVII